MAAKKSYKRLLTDCLNLQAEGGKSARRRAEILCGVYEDTDFLLECGTLDRDAEEVLDDYVEDLCVSFLELRAMYKAFPQAEEWGSGKLKTLHEKTVELAAKSKPEAEPRQVTRVTKADLKRIEGERDDFAAQVRYLKPEVERLQEENRELRDENIRLEARLNELERVLNRELAAA